MRSWSRRVGLLLCTVGALIIVASAVMSYVGMNPSYNLGDPTKFEFVLIPFWQIGVLIAALGGVCLLAARMTKNRA